MGREGQGRRVRARGSSGPSTTEARARVGRNRVPSCDLRAPGPGPRDAAPGARRPRRRARSAGVDTSERRRARCVPARRGSRLPRRSRGTQRAATARRVRASGRPSHPRSAAASTASASVSSASESSRSSCATPSIRRAIGRQALDAPRSRTAISASLRIVSAPLPHIAARTTASQGSSVRLPSGRIPFTVPRSAAASHRFAAAGLPPSE